MGVIILGDYTLLEEGGEGPRDRQAAAGAGRQRAARARRQRAGAEPIDGKGPIASDLAYPVEKIAPGIMRRRPISQPVQTGIMAIDAMIPIGPRPARADHRDRSTGKTTICIDTIISQAQLNRDAEARGDKDTARSTASTSPSARSSPRSRSLSPCSKKRRDARTRSSSRRRPPTPRRASISRRLPARRWANGSWTTAWTR